MDMQNELLMKANRSIIRCIEKVLPRSKYEYRVIYYGRSIEVLSKNRLEDTRLYIRVVNLGNRIAVDLSNMDFDPKIQHKGKFTCIVDGLKHSRSVKEIWVNSVLTTEMHNACRKCGMTYAEELMGYKYVSDQINRQ